MAFLGYHHAQVSIPPGGQVEARRFYGTVLGMPEIPLPASVSGRALLWFAVGDRSLHLSVEDGIDRARTKAHLAYEVDDIADCRRRLLADGRELVEQPPLGRVRPVPHARPVREPVGADRAGGKHQPA